MFDSLKERCCKENLKLPELDLVIYTFGNVSIVDREHGVMAIKPSGVDYSLLTPDKIVIVDLASGKVIDGSYRPSSDTNTHLVLYREFPTIGGIVHTHSTFAVAWAQAKRNVPVYGTTHADHLATEIPCTEFMSDARIQNDYETETGLQITEHFRSAHLNPNEIQMILVAGHGPFTWGATAEIAVYNSKVLEELCKMAFLTEQIHPGCNSLKQSLIDKHYNRKHGKDAYYGQK
mgnify:CR=1 FL=1